MALSNSFRSAAKLLPSSESLLSKSASVSRGFHSTGVKRMGGGHGHDEPYYMHAKHMYNLDRMKHQKLKMSLAVFTAFSIGVAVPVLCLCSHFPANEDSFCLAHQSSYAGSS